jgi:IS605 OrfB family transposase
VSGADHGARLVKDPLGWHISFRIEEPALEVAANPGPPVGVDLGVVHSMALSTGELIDMPRLLSHGEEQRLLGLERKAARQRLAFEHRLSREPAASRSKRQHRTYQQIAGLRARQARRRQDWLHKQTTRLAKNHGVVVVEDLRIQNMTRSAGGTIDRPGRNVRAKAGLNRSILGMSWAKAGQMVAYKCPLRGGALVKVSARNSSIECARCRSVAPENRVDQASSGVLTAGTKRTATSTPRRYCWTVDSPPEAVPPRDAGGLHARRECSSRNVNHLLIMPNPPGSHDGTQESSPRAEEDITTAPGPRRPTTAAAAAVQQLEELRVPG